ncbi:hypothetical protein C4552_01070 [Candidatus Parcubacteria bacterium]|nr:MAG: hypothetical protein C4552_01070 [Candidatus Parcubacteria bacterium]
MNSLKKILQISLLGFIFVLLSIGYKLLGQKGEHKFAFPATDALADVPESSESSESSEGSESSESSESSGSTGSSEAGIANE